MTYIVLARFFALSSAGSVMWKWEGDHDFAVLDTLYCCHHFNWPGCTCWDAQIIQIAVQVEFVCIILLQIQAQIKGGRVVV